MKFYRWMLNKYMPNPSQLIIPGCDWRETSLSILMAILQVLVDIYDKEK